MILDFLNENGKKYSDRIFAEDPEGSITFGDLMLESRESGKEITENLSPEKPGFPVAIFGEKSTRLLVMMFAVVQAGGFYVILNPEQPRDRLNRILEVLQPALLISDERLAGRCRELDYDGMRAYYSRRGKLWFSRLGRRRIESMDVSEKEDLPLYGIFTSGSTGVPKCVLISHRNVEDFIGHFVETFGFEEMDIIGNQAPFDFDVSVKDIYTALMTGSRLVLIPREYFSTPARLIDYICDRHVTSLTWAVSALCIISGMKGFSYRIPTELRRVMFSGEVMPVSQLRIWQENVPSARYVNLYGPTEITCNCMYYDVDRLYERGEQLPLGVPFPGRRVFLRDVSGQIIDKPGVTGEIVVSGESIGLGYYHNAEQTAAHFLHDPAIGERFYCTGDLAAYCDDGNLYFAGRKDFQIKHMGHRIELEEIEKAISVQPEIDRCVCTYDDEHKRLTAGYTGTIGKRELHLRMKEILPVYMVPNRLLHVKEFVLNKNGKIDRRMIPYLEVAE